MRYVGLYGLLLGLAGCGDLQQLSFAAPPGALDCAIREAERIGYRRIEGGSRKDEVLVGLFLPPHPAQEPTDRAERLSDAGVRVRSDPQFDSQLRMVERDGMVQIIVLAEPPEQSPNAQFGGAMGDARQIMVACEE